VVKVLRKAHKADFDVEELAKLLGKLLDSYEWEMNDIALGS
jgi:hypothetical protein